MMSLFLYLFIHTYTHLQINILRPSRCLKSILRQAFCINLSRSRRLNTIPRQVSKFNFETSFLYQLFKVNSNFIVKKPCKVIYFSIFIFYIILYIYSYVYLCIYTPLNVHFKAFPVSQGLSQLVVAVRL